MHRRRPGAGQANGQVGSDLDVDQPGHPAGAEQAAVPARLPDDARGDDRSGFNRLERIDLDARGQEGLLLNDAVVADDGTLVDPSAAHDVAVSADDCAAQADPRTDEDVVVHN